MQLAPTLIDELVATALREDLGAGPDCGGDLTTRLVLERARRGVAVIVAKQSGVIAGLSVAMAAFRQCDRDAEIEATASDGHRVAAGDTVLRARGDAAALLTAERTALNFLQRMSGIATTTRAYVDAVEGLDASILDTRKTTPGLRAFEKYSVRMGGGDNHRMGLFDQVLLKENHFAWAGGDYESVVARVVASVPSGAAAVIAEVRNLEEARAAVRGGAGIVMLDNFTVPDGLRAGVAAVREAAGAAGREVLIEASGGITLDSVRRVAECGVDRISVGALTHSVRSLDLSMLVELQATA